MHNSEAEQSTQQYLTWINEQKIFELLVVN